MMPFEPGPEPLITAGYVGYLLSCSTQTVRSMARRGELDEAGVVFVGKHGIMFDPVKFMAWRDAGGDRPITHQIHETEAFIVRHHSHREHAGGLPRNDRTRRDPSKALAELVKPDPGVRPFDPMETAPDLAHVEARQYLPGGEVSAV